MLEREQFEIAAKLFRAYLQEVGVGAQDLIIMNGLPRHVDQADDVEALVKITRVVHLACPATIVRDRIAGNTGGDRTGRVDDSMVRHKLDLFTARTAPLIDYYRRKGVSIHRVDVRVDSSPETIVDTLWSEVRSNPFDDN